MPPAIRLAHGGLRDAQRRRPAVNSSPVGLVGQHGRGLEASAAAGLSPPIALARLAGGTYGFWLRI